MKSTSIFLHKVYSQFRFFLTFVCTIFQRICTLKACIEQLSGTLNLETYWTKFEAQEGVSLVQAAIDSFAKKWERKEGILATIYASYVKLRIQIATKGSQG